MAMGKSVTTTIVIVAASIIMTKRRYPIAMTTRKALSAVIITQSTRKKRKRKKLLLSINMIMISVVMVTTTHTILIKNTIIMNMQAKTRTLNMITSMTISTVNVPITMVTHTMTMNCSQHPTNQTFVKWVISTNQSSATLTQCRRHSTRNHRLSKESTLTTPMNLRLKRQN